MKAFYVLVLTIGVCLANEKTLPDLGHPSHAPVPKAPMVQTNTAAHYEKEDKTEVPVNHDDDTQHSSPSSKITSSIAPTTAPIPTSTTTIAPPPAIGKWNVTDDKGEICILLKGKIALNLVNETDHKTIKTLEVPSNAPNHGNCADECIKWDLPNNSSLHFMFAKNSSKFYLHAVKAVLSYDVDNKTINGAEFSNDTLHLFENPLNQSYACERLSENVVAQKPFMHLTLKVESFQVQAFKNSTSKDFDTAVDCEAPPAPTPDVVPIVVGCALAILVVLVLVAYLISRRRSQSRGYFSM